MPAQSWSLSRSPRAAGGRGPSASRPEAHLHGEYESRRGYGVRRPDDRRPRAHRSATRDARAVRPDRAARRTRREPRCSLHAPARTCAAPYGSGRPDHSPPIRAHWSPMVTRTRGEREAMGLSQGRDLRGLTGIRHDVPIATQPHHVIGPLSVCHLVVRPVDVPPQASLLRTSRSRSRSLSVRAMASS